MGAQSGLVVLHDRLDPELCICFPLTRFLCFLPPIATAYRSASILSTNMNGSFQLMLVKHRLHRSIIRTQTVVSPNQVFSVLSRQKRPPVAGEWGSIVERLIPRPRARFAKANAFTVVIASLDGRVVLLPGSSSNDGLLGFIAMDTDGIMFWTVNGSTDWTWHATVHRNWISAPLGIARHVELALEWCAPKNGVISLTIHGTTRVILNLNTRKPVRDHFNKSSEAKGLRNAVKKYLATNSAEARTAKKQQG